MVAVGVVSLHALFIRCNLAGMLTQSAQAALVAALVRTRLDEPGKTGLALAP